MKGTGLLLIALSVVALAEASHHDYLLKCSHSEMGIRWPSYKSHSEYYVCHRLGDRPMVISCNAGEVFTFVLQMCTTPSRFIPAPALEILPTDSPLTAHLNNKHNTFKPLHIGNVAHPPIYSESAHHVPLSPPVMTFDAPKPPTLSVVAPNTEPEEHANHLEAPQESAKPHKPVVKPPMPPTPAPTPPVVDDEIEKIPSKSQDKHIKKPSAPAKPNKSDDKKPTSTNEEKKSPKKPTNTKTKQKDSKNKPKKTPAPVKKSPKAPTKA